MTRNRQAHLHFLQPSGLFGGFGSFLNPWQGQGFVQNSLPYVGPYLFPEHNMAWLKPKPGTGTGGKAGGVQPAAASPQASNVWEQIGGLDGLIAHMGKMQKMLQMAQSMSPLMKLFTQSTGTGMRGGRRKGQVPAVKAGSRLARDSRRLSGRMHV